MLLGIEGSFSSPRLQTQNFGRVERGVWKRFLPCALDDF
jgi:hypothetical protein